MRWDSARASVSQSMPWIMSKYDLASRALRRWLVLNHDHVPWHDYLVGAGLAFDPLPYSGRTTFHNQTFEPDDQVALITDLLTLLVDRDAAMRELQLPSEPTHPTAENTKPSYGKNTSSGKAGQVRSRSKVG
jgi:hypothetical protein